MTERRYDPTSGEWVTFATHRQHRTYKPNADFCPLCPSRPGSPATEIPFESFEVVTFDNRFPSFSPNPPAPDIEGSGLLGVKPAAGRCEVLVYSDDHTKTMADLSIERVRMLVDIWTDRWVVIGSEREVSYVMPFENKGEVVGTTLSHPHGQIYGYPEIPSRPLKELLSARRYLSLNGTCVECDVVANELDDGRRVVASNERWLAWVPFWARFPYEVHVATKVHRPSLAALDQRDRAQLAEILLDVTRTYDALWGFSLPYIMAFHQRPTNEDEAWDEISHLHIEFSPPNRTRDRLKFLAGSELAGGAFVTDVSPEVAATSLRKARAKKL